MAKVSLLVPAYNERPMVQLLFDRLRKFIDDNDLDWEVVFVDDGSTDQTYEEAQRCKPNERFVLARSWKNRGKTSALLIGAEYASADVLVVFDADLQFSPEDALTLVNRLEEGYDLVTGKKVGSYQKPFVSGIYNLLTRILFGLKVQDMNAMKAMRRELFDALPLRKDWHRYIVPLAYEAGFRVSEEPVQVYPRAAGKSKYGSVFRVPVGFFDLLAVKFQLTVMRKPLLYLGSWGFTLLVLGGGVGIGAVVLRYVFGMGFRPVLYLVILLVLAGLILVAMGMLGEVVAGMQDELHRAWRASRRKGR